MSEFDVKIVKLEPIRVVSFNAYGANPEIEAGKKLIAWAKSQGMFKVRGKHRIFGFNNPMPSPGSPNYGYEFWITIGPDEKANDETIKEFSGGLYAIEHCEVKNDPYESIPAAWMKLGTWLRGNSRYHHDTSREGLEEHVAPFPFENTGDFSLDLYAPILELETK